MSLGGNVFGNTPPYYTPAKPNQPNKNSKFLKL